VLDAKAAAPEWEMMLDLVLPRDDLGQGPAVVLLNAGVADRRMWSDLCPPLPLRAIARSRSTCPVSGTPRLRPRTHRTPLFWKPLMPWMSTARPSLESHSAVPSHCASRPLRRRASAGSCWSRLPRRVEPSAELQAVWEAEEAALQRGDIDAAVRAMVDAWTLPGAPPELCDRVARMQRRAFELQAVGDAPAPGDDPLERTPTVLVTLDTPALVAHGEFDMPDFVLGAQQLHGSCEAGPSWSGHLAPLEQPPAFRDLALKFLGETSAPADTRWQLDGSHMRGREATAPRTAASRQKQACTREAGARSGWTNSRSARRQCWSSTWLSGKLLASPLDRL
jgi:3-oxoadipate enol-lactonase